MKMHAPRTDVCANEAAGPLFGIVESLRDGRMDLARNALAHLPSVRGSELAHEAVSAAVHADMSVLSVTGSMIVTCEVERLPAVQTMLQFAFDRLGSFVDAAEGMVLIVVADGRLGIPFTQLVQNGLTVVGVPPDRLCKTVLTHELAHAVLASGNRLLDEGFADLVSEPSDAPRAPPHGPPLGDLLTEDWTNDLQFGKAWRNEQQRRGLRQRARDLVEALLERNGPTELRALFGYVRSEPEHVVAIVETNLGMSLRDWDNRPTPELLDLQQRIGAAQNDRDLVALQALAAEALEAAIGAPSWRSIDLGVVAELASARECLLRGDPVEPTLISTADSWIVRATQLGLPKSRQLVLSAHRETLALIAANNAGLSSRAASSAARISGLLEAALDLEPNDLDASGAHDRFLAYKRLAPSAVAHAAAVASDVIRSEGSVPAIELKGISYTAPAGFSLEIEHLSVAVGERLALVGPNGSGKSTLLEVVLGLIPSRGERLVFGKGVTNSGLDVVDRRRVGALLAQAPIQRTTSVSEAVVLVDAVFGRADPLVYDALGISEIAKKKVGELSRGQYQRVMLYHALGHSPELIILDEPSLGLDQQFGQNLRKLLYGDWGAGRTIVVCSHHADDLGKADRVVLMKDGRLQRHGKISDLIATLDWTWRGILEGVDAVRGLRLVQTLDDHRRSKGERDTITSFGGASFAREFAAFALSQPYTHLSLRRAGIEDVIYGGGNE